MNMTAISNLSPASRGVASPNTTAKAMPGLDGSEFMMVVLAQLKHQNPLKPVDDSQMIAQMAQLNSLQELQKISGTLEAMLFMLEPEVPVDGGSA